MIARSIAEGVPVMLRMIGLGLLGRDSDFGGAVDGREERRSERVQDR